MRKIVLTVSLFFGISYCQAQHKAELISFTRSNASTQHPFEMQLQLDAMPDSHMQAVITQYMAKYPDFKATITDMQLTIQGNEGHETGAFIGQLLVAMGIQTLRSGKNENQTEIPLTSYLTKILQ